MKRGTKILIAATAMLYAVELLFVPFEVRYVNGLSQAAGYSFILHPPAFRGMGEIVIEWGKVWWKFWPQPLQR